jgi:hypothetical protein
MPLPSLGLNPVNSPKAELLFSAQAILLGDEVGRQTRQSIGVRPIYSSVFGAAAA